MFRPFSELNFEYVELDKDIGYWIIHNPMEDTLFDEWKNKLESYDGYVYSERRDSNNPFLTANFDDWNESLSGFYFLRDFYRRLISSATPEYEEKLSWINRYEKDKCWCPKSSGLPHNDVNGALEGLVANLWMSEDIEGSGTKMYKFNGKMYRDGPLYSFDFLIDKRHPKHKDYNKYMERINYFPNLSDEELQEFGYEYVGMAPAVYKKMTIYRHKLTHVAYIPDNINYRLSSCFLYGVQLHPWLT